MPRIVASEEGGIAAELTQLQQNQVLLVRKTRLCVPILCPEVIAPPNLPKMHPRSLG
jgi:hypothetical protein